MLFIYNLPVMVNKDFHMANDTPYLCHGNTSSIPLPCTFTFTFSGSVPCTCRLCLV